MQENDAMAAARPFPWERSYPPGIAWDAALRPAPLGALLAESAARFGDRHAIVYRDRPLSYRDLARYVLSVAAGVRGIQQAGRGVAILLPNSAWHTICFFGIVSAGLHVVQLSPLDAMAELVHKVRDSGARVLITLAEPELAARAGELAAMGLVDRVVALRDDVWGGEEDACAVPGNWLTERDLLSDTPLAGPMAAELHSVALLQYTGGTTGLPKAAELTHFNVAMAAMTSAYWQSLRPRAPDGDRTLMTLPLFHIYALTMVVRHLLGGNTIWLRRRFEAEACLADLERNAITVFHGVPTMWIAMLKSENLERRDLSALNFLTSGGAPLPVEVARAFEERTGIPIHPGWGMTEAAAIGCQHAPGGEVRAGSIGLPLPGIEIRVGGLDGGKGFLPAGETGEILLRAPNLFRRYHNQPEENAAAFVDGYFRTGDVGWMDADGFVYLTDRKKDMILSSGFNVYPRIIEEAIYSHPGVSECIVAGIADPYRGEAAKAYVVLKPGAEPFTLKELQRFLEPRLGRHEMPQALDIRDRLPKTAVGKLSRRLVQEDDARRGA